MFTWAALCALCLFLLYLAFPDTFRAVSRPLLGIWWRGNVPRLVYRQDSQFCAHLLAQCSILTERYSPPLWGYIGHLQTIIFSVFDRFGSQPVPAGTRVKIPVSDGSVMSYDLFEPEGDPVPNLVLFVIPGVNNTAESGYIKSFISACLKRQYRVAVLNHMGALKNVPLQGPRIFTYGGTGDTFIMFKDLIHRYGDDTEFVGVGYSLGAYNLVRFLAEREEIQKKFTCIFSFCQGYCPDQAVPFLGQWTEARRGYSYIIGKRLVKLVQRHRDQLIDNKTTSDLSNCADIPVSNIGEGRDMNGFPLDKSRVLEPDPRLWTSTSILHFDDYYSRRVMGFKSLMELYEWASSKTFMNRISSVPIIFVNSLDDPIIPEALHEAAIEYVKEHNSNAILVQTHHGGHLGYYEGGIIYPNDLPWCDRVVFECIPVIRKLTGKY